MDENVIQKEIRQLLGNSIKSEINKKLREKIVEKGKRDLKGYVEILDCVLESYLEYSHYFEYLFLLNEVKYPRKIKTLREFLSYGKELELVKTLLTSTEKDVLEYHYSILPIPEEEKIETMIPLSGSFHTNFYLSHLKLLAEILPFSTFEEFLQKINKSKYASELLSRFHDNKPQLMFQRITRIYKNEIKEDPNKIRALVSSLEAKINESRNRKERIMEKYRESNSDVYNKLVLLDRLLESDNLKEYTYMYNLLSWRAYVYQKLSREFGLSFKEVLTNPEKLISSLKSTEQTFYRRFQYDIPFYKQTDLTCGVACFLNVLRIFKGILPNKQLEFDIWSRVRVGTHPNNLLPCIGVVAKEEYGLPVRFFINRKNVLDHIKNDERVIKFYKCMDRVPTEERVLSFDDYVNLLRNGYMVITASSSDDESLHANLIYGYSKDYLKVFDPLYGKKGVTKGREEVFNNSYGYWSLAVGSDDIRYVKKIEEHVDKTEEALNTFYNWLNG